jgi:hypothetical protein
MRQFSVRLWLLQFEQTPLINIIVYRLDAIRIALVLSQNLAITRPKNEQFLHLVLPVLVRPLIDLKFAKRELEPKKPKIIFAVSID